MYSRGLVTLSWYAEEARAAAAPNPPVLLSQAGHPALERLYCDGTLPLAKAIGSPTMLGLKDSAEVPEHAMDTASACKQST